VEGWIISISQAGIIPQVETGRETYACAPSDRAMNGKSGHSLSIAGSLPSSAPNHDSTSGPLQENHQPQSPRPRKRASYLAWWKPTTVTRGVKPPSAVVILSLLQPCGPPRNPRLRTPNRAAPGSKLGVARDLAEQAAGHERPRLRCGEGGALGVAMASGGRAFRDCKDVGCVECSMLFILRSWSWILVDG
jgi:hypothetical protein